MSAPTLSGAGTGLRTDAGVTEPGPVRRPATRPPRSDPNSHTRPTSRTLLTFSTLPTLSTLAELVRAPAAITVPGDVLAGALASGRAPVTRTLGLTASSVALYWAGMALNDWADRDEDAVERPERPIPSGRLSAGAALAVAVGLTGAGLGIAALAGGRRTVLRRTLPLAAAVWAYDLGLKSTPLGPAAMAAARGLDVLHGAASGRTAPALPAAATIAAHTLAVTRLSRHEVHGAPHSEPRVSLATTAAITATLAAPAARLLTNAARRSAQPATTGLLASVAGLLASGVRSSAPTPTAGPEAMAARNPERASATGQSPTSVRSSGTRSAAGLLASAFRTSGLASAAGLLASGVRSSAPTPTAGPEATAARNPERASATGQSPTAVRHPGPVSAVPRAPSAPASPASAAPLASSGASGRSAAAQWLAVAGAGAHLAGPAAASVARLLAARTDATGAS
ncbi:SCO3242 family prenyltransferase, partial [Streptomyces sp. SID3212]|uniref:SCO3242 family prenyltransferase n=1 Tax=Streptomyces sp. SID3212 TaxID=2690259 RepID=UPI00136A6626|nr:hypothetical protein [Streptomyces sp. SID3212]